jgi:hypothetical protein
MRRHGIGCLPIKQRGRFAGLVTVSDLLALLERLEPDEPQARGRSRSK